MDVLQAKLVEMEVLQPHDDWQRGYYQCLLDLQHAKTSRRLLSWFDVLDDATWPFRAAIGDAWESAWVRGVLGVIVGIAAGGLIF
jgi:hypothetical protein